MKTRTLLLAAAALLAVTAAQAENSSILLKAPSPDNKNCFVHINKDAVPCALALYTSDAKRVRIQFNNDDSGRMVLFEGKKTSTEVVIIDAITMATVAGQPAKTKMVKAVGLCSPFDEKVWCEAYSADERLFTATVEHNTQ